VISYGACHEFRQELAVYVLGAIEPWDRDIVDQHVAQCGHCRQELAGLAGVPALLRRVPPGEATALLAGESGGSRDDLPSGPAFRQLLARTGRNRRRQVRIRVAAAAAVGLIGGAGALAGWQAAHPAAQQAGRAAGWSGTASAADPHTGAAAAVRYASRPWGLQLSVQLSGIPVGTTCQVIVIGKTARTATAGSWIIGGGRANWYPASSAEPLADVRSFDITSGSKVLVSIPVRGNAATPPPPAGASPVFGGWPAR
jgi:hypothetical protein